MPVYNPKDEHGDWEMFELTRGDETPFNGTKDSDATGCAVSSPTHYTVGGYEAIDVLRAKLTRSEYIGYCKGNILKYLMRANYKGHHDQDLKKAAWYMRELEDAIKKRDAK